MNIISRSQWGAKPPTSAFYKPNSLKPASELWKHHFANNAWNGHLGMRQCQAFHQNTKGWKDIAYSFCVDDDGSVFEGRGFGVAGGHTQGHNTISYAVSGMNNFSVNKPTDRYLNAVAELVVYGHDKGWFPHQFTGGHRDVGSTACPGDYMYAALPELNRRIRDLDQPKPPTYDYAVSVIYNPTKPWDEALAHAFGMRFRFAVNATDHSAKVGFAIPIGYAGITLTQDYPEGTHTVAGATGIKTSHLVMQYIRGDHGEPDRRHPWQ